MKNIHCDNCGKSITIKLKEKKHGKGITETYFTCRNCKANYTAFVLDADARRMQREIRGLHLESTIATNDEDRSCAVDKLRGVKGELKVLMDELKISIK